MNPQISELPCLSCWVQKKKRSLPSIFGESYVKKWLIIDPVSRKIEYSDKMHGTTKLLGSFENVLEVKFDHKHQSKRALSITVRKKMPRQAQDAHEITLFVFEEDLSLSLAIQLFYSHPLRLLSEAEKLFLPKHIFDLLPKPIEPQMVKVLRVTKPIDAPERSLQITEKQEVIHLGMAQNEATPMKEPCEKDFNTEVLYQTGTEPLSLQGIYSPAKAIGLGELDDSRPAVSLQAQKPQSKLINSPQTSDTNLNQESNREPVVGVPGLKLNRTGSLRLNLRLDTTRNALKPILDGATMPPAGGLSSNRVLQIRPHLKQGPARVLAFISHRAAQDINMRPAKMTPDLDSDDSQIEVREQHAKSARPFCENSELPGAPSQPPFKPIKLTIGKSRLREQPLALSKPLPLDK